MARLLPGSSINRSRGVVKPTCQPMSHLPVVVLPPQIRGIIGELAPVAQWTEYLTSNQLVGRSSRPGGVFHLNVRVAHAQLEERFAEGAAHGRFSFVIAMNRAAVPWRFKYFNHKPFSNTKSVYQLTPLFLLLLTYSFPKKTNRNE
jgi:hypothetical protein